MVFGHVTLWDRRFVFTSPFLLAVHMLTRTYSFMPLSCVLLSIADSWVTVVHPVQYPA